jgi:hypothetical protein
MTTSFKLALCKGLMLALAFVPVAAQAGGLDGGGSGGVIRCEDPDGDRSQIIPTIVNGKVEFQIVKKQDLYQSPITNGRKFQLTELFEADTGYGPFYNHRLRVDYNSSPVKDQVLQAVRKLIAINPAFGNEVAKIIERIRIMPIPENAAVADPVDTAIRFLPVGCKLHGFGDYSDADDNLVLDPTVVKDVATTDIAAIYLHEAIYKVLRSSENAKNSWKTRRMVGLLFSTSMPTWKEMNEGFD